MLVVDGIKNELKISDGILNRIRKVIFDNNRTAKLTGIENGAVEWLNRRMSVVVRVCKINYTMENVASKSRIFSYFFKFVTQNFSDLLHLF